MRSISDYMQVLPVVECADHAGRVALPPGIYSPNVTVPRQMAHFNVTAEAYGHFLCDVYDAWRKRDIYDEVGGKIYFCKPDGSKETTIFDDPELLIRALDMRRHQNKLVCDLNAIVEDEFDNGEMMPHVKAAEGGKLVIDLTTGEYRIYGKTW